MLIIISIITQKVQIFMKRSKAFILVEILTSMALQAGFIIVLCTSFYLMLSFYTRTQQTLTARQKGEKVIAYVDARIRNVGLGLHACSNSSEVRNGFDSGLRTALWGTQNLTLPVAVTSGNWNYKAPSGGKFTGNRLTLLYPQRPLDNKTFIIRTMQSPDNSGINISIDITQTSRTIGFVTGSGGTDDYNASEFSPATSSRSLYMNSYTVMAGAGRPICISRIPDNNGAFNINLLNGYSVTVYPGDELLYLKCERMYVEGQNFKFQRSENDAARWTNAYSNEDGILDIYFELDTNNRILDMYVLASGGYNDSGDTQKPAIWKGTWTSDYANYIVYVSRASWKLSNISSSFTWN